MTRPPERVRIKCPRCRNWYEGWFCPSINLTLEPWLSQEEVEEMATVSCPKCGRKIWLASIVVEGPRDWVMPAPRSRFFGSRRRRKLRRRVRIEPIRD